MTVWDLVGGPYRFRCAECINHGRQGIGKVASSTLPMTFERFGLYITSCSIPSLAQALNDVQPASFRSMSSILLKMRSSIKERVFEPCRVARLAVWMVIF